MNGIDSLAPVASGRRARRHRADAAAPSFRGWSAGVAGGERVRRIVVWVTIVLIYRQTFAAPIRAFAPFLWYVPDVLMAGALLAIAGAGMRDKVVPVIVSVGALALLVVYSLLSNKGYAVALAVRGLGYILLAFFAGLGVRRDDRLLPFALVAAAAISIVGVYYDALFSVPWAGMEFEGFGGTADAARQWSAAGSRRLSGLGIASTDTSVIIAAGTLVYLSVTRNRLRPSSALFCAAAVHALVLTTQKATAGWLILTVLAAYVAPLVAFRRAGFHASALLRPLGVLGLVASMLVPPIFAGFNFSAALRVNAATLDQRMIEVWPRVLPHLLDFPQVLLGFGLGGIGATGLRPDLAMIDNMFLYVALTLGLPAAVALFTIAARALLATPLRDGIDFAALALVALLALNGITANIVVAGAVGSIYLGYAVGCLLRPLRRTRSRRRGGHAGAAAPVAAAG
ncbi:hypothetical protein KZ813_15600 [Sphingomonas sp. RHCKR7]|uniref:hypothetical protein n=1 Tax=Sphingomonas folli TaxID=2862497 RepID=UPI001CA46FDF|nr:hypothetical protein [Sphingomonas folli]MBW6528266.1 hypothetical protein [Sphingomonas folli]